MISKDIREKYICNAERTVDRMVDQYAHGVRTLSDLDTLQRLVMVVRAHEEMLEKDE